MLGVREPIVDVIARRIREGYIRRIVKRRISRIAGFRQGEWEPMRISRAIWRLEIAIGTGHEWLVKQRRLRRNPIEAERRVPNLIEQVQIFNRCVIDSVGRADTGLARATEDFAGNTIGESWRIRQTYAWRKIIVLGMSQRAWDARVARNNPAERGCGELR